MDIKIGITLKSKAYALRFILHTYISTYKRPTDGADSN